MNLFIANNTTHRMELFYRVPSNSKLMMRPIAPNSQTRIDNLSQGDIDAIVEQHAPYGMIKSDETAKRTVAPLCYSVDKMVPAVKMETLFLNNMAALSARGRELRQNAAIASNEAVNQMLQSEREQGLEPPEMSNFEMSVVEEEPKDGYGNKADHVAEGFRVARPGQPADTPSTGRRRR